MRRGQGWNDDDDDDGGGGGGGGGGDAKLARLGKWIIMANLIGTDKSESYQRCSMHNSCNFWLIFV